MTHNAEIDAPPQGTRTTCGNCDLPIIWHDVDGWLHEGALSWPTADPVPCEVDIPVAEPAPGWDWRVTPPAVSEPSP